MTTKVKIQEWSAQDLATKQKDCELIDVRRPDEFVGPLSHIEGAQLVTLGSDLDKFLQDSADRLKNSTVVFICRSGARSMTAAQQALGLGYTQPVNLAGGMIGWNDAKLKVAKVG